MPSIDAPAFAQAFAANGSALGSIQVASSAGFNPAATVFLSRDSHPGARGIVVSIPDSTHVVVRIVADDNEQQQAVQRYGAGSDLSTWTVVSNAKVWQPAQLVKVEASYIRPAGLNV